MSQIDYSALINDDNIEDDSKSGIMTLADANESWTKDYRYDQTSYYDESYTTIDSLKNIKVDSGQINITQESNSQFIPFEMPRYYDGLDLALNTSITIYYLRSDKQGEEVVPKNVEYNPSLIHFGWVVDEKATAKDGNIDFEIRIRGLNDLGEPFLWKTKPSIGQLKVLKGLAPDATITIDDSWMQEIVDRFMEVVENAELGLSNYYTKQEVNNLLGNVTVDLTGYATEGYVDDKIDELATVATSGSYNDLTDKPIIPSIEGLINEQTLNDRIGDIGESENVVDYVTNAISEVDVSEQLGDLGVNVDEEGKETPKTVKQYVDESIDGLADVAVSGDYNDLTNKPDIPSIDGLVHEDRLGNVPADKTVAEYIDESIEGLADVAISGDYNDLSNKPDIPSIESLVHEDRLGNIPAEKTVADYVDEAVAAIDVSERLGDLGEKEDEEGNKVPKTVKEYVDESVANVEVDLTGYATEEYVNGQVNPVKNSVNSISTVVAQLQQEVGSIDKSPKYTYDLVYNDASDPDVGENYLAFYEIQNEGMEGEVRTRKAHYEIKGGGGGPATSTQIKINYITTSPVTVANDDKAVIKYSFTGTDASGDALTEGTAVWSVGGTVVETQDILAGDNEFDVTKYLFVGTQKVELVIKADGTSSAPKRWNVQKIDIRIESSFNDKVVYPIGPVEFEYTPHGSVNKTVHFKLDGKALGTTETSVSNLPLTYEIPQQRNGAHLLEAWITAIVNDVEVESNHIFKDILWYNAEGTVSVIGSTYQDVEIRQYETLKLDYTVYSPATANPTITIKVDDVVVSTPTLTKPTNEYSVKFDTPGQHKITITCPNPGSTVLETVKELTINVVELDIDVSPIAGAVFDFDPAGRTNADRAEREDGSAVAWTNGNISLITDPGFDWVKGGFDNYDENGNQYFCIKAGTYATIDYDLFGNTTNPKDTGKEFKLIFKTEKVARPDATFLSCVDNTNETDHIGIRMDVHEAFIYAKTGKLHLPYSEDDIIEFEFNISKKDSAIPMVMGYEDGVATSPMVYNDGHSFVQDSPKQIRLGSPDCDLRIYKFKVYNNSLTDRQILQNFIADARSAEEMINRHDRNQIYDKQGNLTPEALAEKCPWLRVIKISAPHFTTGKKYPVGNSTIEYIYKNGAKEDCLSYWKCTDAVHVGQGTSSDDYGASGRNMDLVLKKHKDIGNNPEITVEDPLNPHPKKVALTKKSVPVNYFNIKVNIASSENANNALLQKRYNEYNPFERPFVRDEGYDTSMIKDTMEFFNCVVFIQETDTERDANGKYINHKEFNDTGWHFYAIGNIGDSKKTDDTRLTDPDDKYECINEIVDVELPLSDFPATLEAIAILENEKFDKKGTYEWRYLWEGKAADGATEEEKAAVEAENAAVAEYCKQRWIDFYKAVVAPVDLDDPASVAAYKRELEKHIVLDSVLYYYLFTTRYTMVDNRAKNTFWHYGLTNDKDPETGEFMRKWDLAFDYDNDTALGTNNYGDMVYRYGLEDTDVDENGIEVFRESDSTFFCRIRDVYANELAEKYRQLDSAWSAESLISQFDTWQSEFPEELWRLDIERKYIRTYNSSYIDGKGDSQFLNNMAHGKKKYQRRQFERNQERYMASKYQSSAAASDANSIVLRCVVPSGELAIEPNYSLTLVPYAHMYVNVQYSTKTLSAKGEPNVPITLTFDGDSTDIVKIYSGYWLQSIGDISACYPKTVNSSVGEKLKQFKLGNDKVLDLGDGEYIRYDNPYVETIDIQGSELLEELNIENVSGYKQSFDISSLGNLRTMEAKGSGITALIADGNSELHTIEIPGVDTLSTKRLVKLANLEIEDYTKITELVVEETPGVDWLSVVSAAINLKRFRMTGIEWQLEDADILERIYNMVGPGGTGESVLSGVVTVDKIKEKDLEKYRGRWRDLTIIPTKVLKQYQVIYKNPDGSIWEELTDWAVERETTTKPTFIPTQAPSAQYNYEFKYWRAEDSTEEFNFETKIMSNLVLVAEYTAITRTYTVRYLDAKGGELQRFDNVPYGNYVEFNDKPTDTSQEAIGIYSLFAGWSESGYVTGNKDIQSLWQTYVYGENTVNGTSLEETPLNKLRPVELYALLKEKSDEWLCEQYEDYGDTDVVSLQMGQTFDNFTDLNPVDYKSAIKQYTGSDQSYYDTKESLLENDEDFVFVIDYRMLPVEGTLVANYAQNFGLKLISEGGSQKLIWGKSSVVLTSGSNREVLVVVHKKGEAGIDYYFSNKANQSLVEGKLEEENYIPIQVPLTFGAEKSGNSYTNRGQGEIFWVRKFNGLLGKEECRALASWSHEQIEMFPCIEYVDATTKRMKSYPISNDQFNGKTRMTLMSSYVLETPIVYGNGYQPKWETSDLRAYLNNRLLQGVDPIWRQLMKQADISTVFGENNNNAEITQDYIYLPAVYYLTGTGYSSEGKEITCFPTADSRVAYKTDGKTKVEYWVRSGKNNYRQYINTSGEVVDEWSYNTLTPKYLRMMLNF